MAEGSLVRKHGTVEGLADIVASDSVLSLDVHPTDPRLAVTTNYGCLYLWDYKQGKMVASLEVGKVPVRAAKFIAPEQWVVTGADDGRIYVYNYKTKRRVKELMANSRVTCLVLHPTPPNMLLSSGDNGVIEKWDWKNEWVRVEELTGNFKDPLLAIYPENGENGYINAITGSSDDNTIKVRCLNNENWSQELRNPHNVSAVGFYNKLNLLITGLEDGSVVIWRQFPFQHNYKYVEILNYGLGSVQTVGYMEGSKWVAIGFNEGIVLVKFEHYAPIASMDNSGSLVWARGREILISQIENAPEVKDGEKLDLYFEDKPRAFDLQGAKYSRDGYLALYGFGNCSLSNQNATLLHSYNGVVEFVWSSKGEYAVWERTSKINQINLYRNNFEWKYSFCPKAAPEHMLVEHSLHCTQKRKRPYTFGSGS